MSVIMDNVGIDGQSRSALATKKLCETIGIPSPKLTDLKFLTIALTEAAAVEASHNQQFAEDIRVLFANLNPPKTVKSKEPAKSKEPKESKRISTVSKEKTYSFPKGLTPIKHIEMSRFNPFAPPDPYLLHEAFGDDQLYSALQGYSLPVLKDIASLVEKNNLNTSPKNKGKKESVLEYILQKVTNKSE